MAKTEIENNTMSIPNHDNCDDAKRLVPSYLDGELSEAQAGPLRRHLLACSTCRAEVQDLASLKKWFVTNDCGEQGLEIPAGFAARVTRRAFAGERGTPEQTERLVPLPSASEVAADAGESLLKFVLQVTSIAAALLIAISLAMRATTLPAGEDLLAEESLEEALDRLDELNQGLETPRAQDSGGTQR
ncbi:MAG: hypothetical protein CMJ87_08515 [Planctomycetes bacterium]|nr:hypothetical protein [Planctomycetota bacterium]